MRLLIGADLVPTDSNISLFCNGDSEKLVGQELKNILDSADYRIFNLEVPLTDRKTPIKKCGPALIAPTDTAQGYKALGVDLLTLANNHIMDQAEQGLFSTIKALQANQIAYVGAGENLQVAQKPYVLEVDGKKIGIYACAEHEFSIAEADMPGANPFDPLESPDHVAELKKQCDYVIVLYHGGKEHYRYPSPMLQKVCRKLVEKGADLVVCQHSHCIGCEEKYKDGTIVYGQGNFLFDRSQNECWQTGLLVQIENGQVSYVPVEKTENTVQLAQGQTAQEIFAAFEERSREMQDPRILNEKYDAFAQSMEQHYLAALGAVNTRSFLFRVANRLTGGEWQRWYLQKKYTGQKCLTIRNYIECEAHQEILLRGLAKKGR